MISAEKTTILGTSNRETTSGETWKPKKDSKKTGVDIQAADATRGGRGNRGGGTAQATAAASTAGGQNSGRGGGNAPPFPPRGGRGGNRGGRGGNRGTNRGRGGFQNERNPTIAEDEGISFGPYPGNARGRGSNTARPSNPQNQVRTTSAWTCPGCSGNNFHGLEICAVFKGMNPSDKFNCVKIAGICLLCMGGGHIAGTCTSTNRCEKCNGRHHTVMCRNDSSASIQCQTVDEDEEEEDQS